MRIVLPALLSLCVSGVARGDDTPKPSDRPEDRAAIAKLNEAFVRAFNRGDAGAIGELFAEDARQIDEDGRVVSGRKAIAEQYAASFREAPGASIRLTTDSLTFVTAEVAVEEGVAEITAPDGDIETSRYTAGFVKRDGRWLQATVRDHAPPSDSPREHLKELAWLVGEWVSEGPDGVVHSTWRWDESGNYLLRAFSVQVDGQAATKGTERIAWDPSARGFRSWVFDDSGEFLESVWTRGNSGEWVMTSRIPQPDGRVAEESRTITRVDKDRVRWKLDGRTLDGAEDAGEAEFQMVRKAPAPR